MEGLGGESETLLATMEVCLHDLNFALRDWMAFILGMGVEKRSRRCGFSQSSNSVRAQLLNSIICGLLCTKTVALGFVLPVKPGWATQGSW